MKSYQKVAGWALVMGSILNLTRNIPVMIGRKNFPARFPPVTPNEISEFVSGNYLGHSISHIMALVSFFLFLFAALYFNQLMKRNKILSNLILLSGALGFGLFFIAALIDSFVLQDAVREFSSNPQNSSVSYLVHYTHNFALIFFSPAIFLIFLFIGVISAGIIMGKFFDTWLGWSGGVLADLSMIGYVTGFMGARWDNFPYSGMVVLFGYVWLFILGIYTIRGPKIITSFHDHSQKTA